MAHTERSHDSQGKFLVGGARYNCDFAAFRRGHNELAIWNQKHLLIDIFRPMASIEAICDYIADTAGRSCFTVAVVEGDCVRRFNRQPDGFCEWFAAV